MQRNWSSITIHNRCINFKSFCDSNEPIMSSDIYHCQKLQFHQKIILQSYYSAEDNEFTFLPLLHLKLCIGMQIKYTYLIGHNNQINGFRTAATHPSWRLYFLRAYASWLHLSMTGLPRFGLSNGYKVALFADFRRFPHQISVSPKKYPILLHTNDMASAVAEY